MKTECVPGVPNTGLSFNGESTPFIAIVAVLVVLAIVAGFAIASRHHGVRHIAKSLPRLFLVIALAFAISLGSIGFAKSVSATQTCTTNTDTGTTEPTAPITAKDVNFTPNATTLAGATITDADGNPSDLRLADLLDQIPDNSPYKAGFGLGYSASFTLNNGDADGNYINGTSSYLSSISLPVIGDNTNLDPHSVDLDPATPGIQQSALVRYGYDHIISASGYSIDRSGYLKYSYDPSTDQLQIAPIGGSRDEWTDIVGQDNADEYQNELNDFYSAYSNAHNGDSPSNSDLVVFDNTFFHTHNISLDVVAASSDNDTLVWQNEGSCGNGAAMWTNNLKTPYSATSADGKNQTANINLPVVDYDDMGCM